jgi:crotonobetainyl-CoA:carnitine CoA-transferase CaiB-like acyl-CoA transferase
MPPLDGIRVLDLSRVLAGPYCTMVLADLGADVIKVERPGEGDETRTWGPPYVGGESAYFLSVNRGKRSVALDLARPDAQEALARLARKAHVVVENFRPGVAERLGAGYERLARENPELVYCSITGFGDDRPGYDFVVEAESGLMSVTGEAGGPPLKVGVAVVDVLAGYAAATGILAALAAGRGERIEISLYDTAVSALVNVSGTALVTGEEPGRFGNAHPSIVPYQTFAAADGLISVAGANDGLYRRLCEVVERPDLAEDERYRSNSSRVAHREELVDELARVFATRPADEWVERFQRAGVPAGKVRGVLEALAEARTISVEHPTVGTLPLVASPLGPRGETTPPPLLGEHTREVLAEVGYEGEQLEALTQPGPAPEAR